MAKAAAPFCHPRVAERNIGKKDIKAERARAIANGTLKSPWSDLLIDLPPVPDTAFED